VSQEISNNKWVKIYQYPGIDRDGLLETFLSCRFSEFTNILNDARKNHGGYEDFKLEYIGDTLWLLGIPTPLQAALSEEE
jgi:hypothetical protein